VCRRCLRGLFPQWLWRVKHDHAEQPCAAHHAGWNLSAHSHRDRWRQPGKAEPHLDCAVTRSSAHLFPGPGDFENSTDWGMSLDTRLSSRIGREVNDGERPRATLKRGSLHPLVINALLEWRRQSSYAANLDSSWICKKISTLPPPSDTQKANRRFRQVVANKGV